MAKSEAPKDSARTREQIRAANRKARLAESESYQGRRQAATMASKAKRGI
jgi:hypothetical protein